jgi:N-acetylneuraminate lyase
MASAKVKEFQVKGLICPPCTPLTDSGEVNYELIPDYVQHHVEFGILNIFLTGTTGEGNGLSNQERKKVVEAWLAAGKGKLQSIIVQVGTGNLKESQELARHAEEVGVNAIACVCPTYHKPQSIDDYVEYMRQVAGAAPNLPFYLYDIDFITGVEFSMDEFFIRAKDKIPTLRGLKHTSPSFPSMNTLLMKHPGYQVFLGSNETYLEALAIGMDITICDSFLGHVLIRLKEAFDKGDLATARLEQNRAIEVCSVKTKHGLSFPGRAKATLRAMGFDVGNPRLPLSPIPESTIGAVKEDLREMGFFDWGLTK